tara:strand:+ start:677 stop:844 length:168 start_codon:yes stop_codon:yes gene_type:complete
LIEKLSLGVESNADVVFLVRHGVSDYLLNWVKIVIQNIMLVYCRIGCINAAIHIQ